MADRYINPQGVTTADVKTTDPQVDYGTPNAVQTINSKTLNPGPEYKYFSPNPTPVPSTDGLDSNYATPPLTATDPEQAAQNESDKLQTLNNELVGKSADQTAAESAAGIPQLNQTQQDLKTQILQLKNEALAIPQQLQLDSTARGITAGGLAPLQTARLRTNAIAALGASSLLDATNGLLASAQTKADKAVAAKYDPIQEQIDAATKNLDLILKSPSYSLADKNRAQAQLDVQKQKQAALDTAKKNTSDVNAVALEAAKNGADALTLQKIMGSTDQASAIAAAGKNLEAPASTSVVESNGHNVLINSKTGATIKDLGPKAAPGGGNAPIQLPDGKGGNMQVPADVAPYYNTTASGVPYADLSAVQGTAAEKKAIVDQAQAAGLKVIINKNTAADLVNIGDANSKLDSIATIMTGIDQPGVLARSLYGLGLTKLATLTQSNPQQAAAGALSSVGLDILKAISGVQGFRGNQSAIQQVTEHLPSIYDTDAVVQQKVAYIRQLISDRENSILGTSGDSNSYKGITLPGSSQSNSGSSYNGITLPN